MTARKLVVAALLAGAGLLLSRADVAAADEAYTQLDGVAAIVGGLAPSSTTITLLHSDVELRARMALLRERSLAAALGEVAPALRKAALESLVGEALIGLEARRLDLTRPDRDALFTERARFIGGGRQGAEMRELFAALGVTERELAPSIERRALVDAFLRVNLEGSLDSSPTELERLFATEPHPFGEAPYEQVRELFARWLSARRIERAVEGWVAALKQRTPHRVLAQYE